MDIGSLGDVVFGVGQGKILSPRGLTVNSSATIQTHSRHMNEALTEFTGTDADAIEFSLRISKYLGVDPRKEMDKLDGYLRTGKALTMVIGKRRFGYKWLIKKIKSKDEYTDKRGDVVSADLSISLVAYAKG